MEAELTSIISNGPSPMVNGEITSGEEDRKRRRRHGGGTPGRHACRRDPGGGEVGCNTIARPK